MQSRARDAARQSAPWREGQSWWVVAIEGTVALIIGLYIVVDPQRASDLIRMLIAVVLLAVSLGQIVDGFRLRGLPSSPWETLRGGVGATVALLTLLSGWSDYIAPTGARQMLAIGLLAYGVIGIVSLIFSFRSTGFKIAAVITDILTIVLGILLLIAEAGDTGSVRLLGAVAIVGGIAMIAYAWMLRSRSAA
jgi:uncharacterized membrane protein HdeD (DUF308 family)